MLGPGLDRVRISVSSPIPPVRGATKLHLEGKLVLLCGAGAKTTEGKDVEFEQNNEVKLGDFSLRVEEEKPTFPAGGPLLGITSAGVRPIVRKVNVKDAGGKEVEVRFFGGARSDKTWTSLWALKKPLKKGKVSITSFTREEKLTVPLQLDVGVGL